MKCVTEVFGLCTTQGCEGIQGAVLVMQSKGVGASVEPHESSPKGARPVAQAADSPGGRSVAKGRCVSSAFFFAKKAPAAGSSCRDSLTEIVK